MNSYIVERHDETAVNCLTGSYAALAGMLGRPLMEQAVFERGDGYLFQAGLDESGYPEYIFPVEETGALGMTRSGFTVRKEPIDADAMGAQIDRLLTEFTGIVVWVNTAHLGYADVYRNSDPYLHAVVIDRIATGHGSVGVLDSLVVDMKPFSCRAELTMADLRAAATDRIRSEAHDGMGFFYTVSEDRTRAADEGAGKLGAALVRQAQRFFAEERFRGAIRRYQELCEECFTDAPERAARGARRLFHHASVLYATPSLKLMGRSLRATGASDTCLELHEATARHWEAMGVLALRFEATSAPSVLDRMGQRFAELDASTVRLWEAIAAG